MATMKRAWPGLTPETRQWLILNNGNPVPGSIALEIIRALGFSTSAAWFAEPVNPEIQLASDEVAWISEVAVLDIDRDTTPGSPERLSA